MPAPTKRPRARRAAWLGLALLLGLGLAPVIGAPGVPATCTRILDLAERAGEPVGPAERDACEVHYAQLRTRRGLLGWTYLAWCTRLAHSIPEAGEC